MENHSTQTETHTQTCTELTKEEELIAVLLALGLADGSSSNKLHNMRVAGKLLGDGYFLLY